MKFVFLQEPIYVASKPAGAYRPPGARGLATPTIFKREDEGGIPPSNGTSTPPRTGTPVNGANGRGPARPRYIPGAPPSTTTPTEGESAEGRKGQGRRKREKGKKDGGHEETVDMGSGRPSTPPSAPPCEPQTPAPAPVSSPLQTPETPAMEGLDPVAKKIRNLSKKLKAIEELKERAARGDKLEMTQLKKIEGEADIRKELKTLGA